MGRPIIVTPARRIDKFRGQPLKPGDATVHEWVADARGLLATSQPALHVESFDNGKGTLQLALPTYLRQSILESTDLYKEVNGNKG